MNKFRKWFKRRGYEKIFKTNNFNKIPQGILIEYMIDYFNNYVNLQKSIEKNRKFNSSLIN